MVQTSDLFVWWVKEYFVEKKYETKVRGAWLISHGMTPRPDTSSILYTKVTILSPVVQSPISTNPGLILNKTYRDNPGSALIGF